MSTPVRHILLPHQIASSSQARSLEGFNTRVGADPRVSGFFSPKSGLLTVQAGGAHDGLVSRLGNRKPASAVNLAEAVSTAMPSLDTDGGPNSRAALRFFSSGTDKLTLADGVFPAVGDWFKLFVFKSPGATSTKYLGRSGTAGNRHMMHLGQFTPGPIPNHVLNRVGASGADATVALPFTPNAWTLAIGTWNNTTKTAGLSMNGGAFSFATNPAAICDETGYEIGSALNEDIISDVIWGPCDLSAAAHEDLLATIREYCREVLGMAV